MSLADLFRPSRYVARVRPLWQSDHTTTCPRCALTYVPSPRWQSCPGCEATRGRRLRELVEAAVAEARADRSKKP